MLTLFAMQTILIALSAFTAGALVGLVVLCFFFGTPRDDRP